MLLQIVKGFLTMVSVGEFKIVNSNLDLGVINTTTIVFSNIYTCTSIGVSKSNHIIIRIFTFIEKNILVKIQFSCLE